MKRKISLLLAIVMVLSMSVQWQDAAAEIQVHLMRQILLSKAPYILLTKKCIFRQANSICTIK